MADFVSKMFLCEPIDRYTYICYPEFLELSGKLGLNNLIKKHTAFRVTMIVPLSTVVEFQLLYYNKSARWSTPVVLKLLLSGRRGKL